MVGSDHLPLVFPASTHLGEPCGKRRKENRRAELSSACRRCPGPKPVVSCHRPGRQQVRTEIHNDAGEGDAYWPKAHLLGNVDRADVARRVKAAQNG
jgi:hypothetical protein